MARSSLLDGFAYGVLNEILATFRSQDGYARPTKYEVIITPPTGYRGTGGTDKVWFYNMEADGYSLDDKRNKIKENDIPDLLNRYHNLEDESNRARTDKSFLVPFDEIKDNDWDLSVNRYKEIVYEEIKYAAPSEIIKDIESLDQERNQALSALKEMLK